MKTLYIIRHAKSSWKNPFTDDFERPLNKRGERNSRFMGKLLQQKSIFPDAIYSSPALRAKKTAKTIAKEIEFDKHIVFKEEIYDASLDDLLEIVHTLSDTYESVFLFGHNPGVNMLASALAGIDENIPTCGIVALEFQTEHWSEVKKENVKILFFDYPKNHDDKNN